MKTDEAAKIYRSIFRKNIPGMVKQRFYNSSLEIESTVPECELINYRTIIKKIADLESVEYASRVLNSNPLLKKKFQLMIYLAECLPENYSIFINEKKGVLKAYFFLLLIPFNSLYKLTKGIFILKIKMRWIKK